MKPDGKKFVLLMGLCALGLILAVAHADAQEYRIQPEDSILISVWNHPDLDTEVVIDSKGIISLPLIGEVAAAGITPRQLEKKLAELWGKDYIKDPAVRVHVQKKRFFVLGEVKNPGSFELLGRMTVLKAISMAGGLTEYAADGSITILRETGPAAQKIEVDISKIKKGKAPDVELRPGDVVNVPQGMF